MGSSLDEKGYRQSVIPLEERYHEPLLAGVSAFRQANGQTGAEAMELFRVALRHFAEAWDSLKHRTRSLALRRSGIAYASHD